MKKHLLLLCLVITLLTITNSAQSDIQSGTGSTTEVKTSLKLTGLKAAVTVYRDERGIPYIEASNEHDLYFAQGYVTATDRLWQMDLFRRNARGELSEIFGKATFEEDKRHKIYGFAHVADEVVKQSSPKALAALQAYADGVNAYIDATENQHLPIEFQILSYRPKPWQPSDSVIIGKNFAESLSSTWYRDIYFGSLADIAKEKLERLFPETSPIDLPVVGSDNVNTDKHQPHHRRRKHRAKKDHTRHRSSVKVDRKVVEEVAAIAEVEQRGLERLGLYAEELAASNNWVVSGKHTETGKPLLANDPHLRPSLPSIWYMTHLNMPGLRVAGVTAAGAPGIIIGHNDSIAWGVTNLGPDVQDLYLETFDKENPNLYKTAEGMREVEIRKEVIKVRKSIVDPSVEAVKVDVKVTRHGPIVVDKGFEGYALRWTALEIKSGELEAFYSINRAKNWQQFCQALSQYPGPTQNFIYADTTGNIGYYGAGKIPIRKTGDGSMPYDGARDEGEWNGFIPFEKLPHLFNPPSGIIVTANNRVVGKDYNYHLTKDWASPYRARRIYDLLTTKEGLSIDYFRTIQGDVLSLSATRIVSSILKIVRQSQDPTAAEIVKRFDNWSGEIVPESQEALILYEMRNKIMDRALNSLLGQEKAKSYVWNNSDTFLETLLEEQPTDALPNDCKDYATLIIKSYEESRELLTKKYGKKEGDWVWGKRATVIFPHPLADAPMVGQRFKVETFPQRGSGTFDTVNVGATVSMRLIADPSNWDNSQQGIALGESGEPNSPHWKDQLADWRSVTPRAFPFSKKAVEAAAKSTVKLLP